MLKTLAKLLFLLPMALSAALISMASQAEAADNNTARLIIFVGGMMKSRSGAT